MSFIAMNTNNPLGHRPYNQMGWLDGAFDFPGAPIPTRPAIELLGGNAAREQVIHPPAIVQELDSPWDAEQPVMMLGAGAVTSTQTLVPTANTTPVTTSAVASGQPAWSAWFTESNLIPGLSNWEVLVGGIAAVALVKALAK